MKNPFEARQTAVRQVTQNQRPSPVHNKPDPVAKTYTAVYQRETQLRNNNKK